MYTNHHERNFARLGGKIAAVLAIIAALLVTFVIPGSPYAHAANLGSDPNAKSADSLSTNSPDECFLWDGVKSNLSGGAPYTFVDVPDGNGRQLGTIEIDDTVYANSCSEAGSSNVVMSGLIYVHWSVWSDAMGTPPPLTVTLQSQAVASGPKATWSAGAGINAGVTAGNGTPAAASAGASANLSFSINPTDSTILNSNSTISNQTSATFSYQNLEASVLTPLGSQVTQSDTIGIQVQGQGSPLPTQYTKVVTSFT